MVYRDDAKTPFGMTGGDQKDRLPDAAWISLPPDKADGATEEGESRFKKVLRTAAKVGTVAVVGIGLVAVGALAVMAASASASAEGDEEEEEKVMKRPGEMGDILRREFEDNPRGYFREHRERMKAARALR
ncbi:hypothetical protein H6P81_014872 [Aristolochia fimbriata]|uniref:Uncharacterized protein n=1 Tax=Aristolochia fimbriata TaxID=158543 RepID=A0AAV7E7R1_ARIFI|nr:hypothetical protein H6P81_014872 [Aristolochia fimbriata]